MALNPVNDAYWWQSRIIVNIFPDEKQTPLSRLQMKSNTLSNYLSDGVTQP